MKARSVPTGSPSNCRDAHATAATSTMLVASTATTNTIPLTGDDCSASIASLSGPPHYIGARILPGSSYCGAAAISSPTLDDAPGPGQADVDLRGWLLPRPDPHHP